MTPIPLVDSPLQLDPLANHEMGAPVPREDGSLPERIDERIIHDCRLLLTLLEAEPLELNGVEGGALSFECRFHPAAGLRFLNARLTITLEIPEAIRIVDLAPTQVHGERVSVTRSRGGQFSVTVAPATAKAELNEATSYQTYHCLLHGSGKGTALARWDFSEDPEQRGGLESQHALFLTLSARGSIQGRVTLSGEVERPRLLGVHDRLVRWFQLGTNPQAPFAPFAVEIP